MNEFYQYLEVRKIKKNYKMYINLKKQNYIFLQQK